MTKDFRPPPPAIVAGLLADLRRSWRRDGAEGEGVHLLCDLVEHLSGIRDATLALARSEGLGDPPDRHDQAAEDARAFLLRPHSAATETAMFARVLVSMHESGGWWGRLASRAVGARQKVEADLEAMTKARNEFRDAACRMGKRIAALEATTKSLRDNEYLGARKTIAQALDAARDALDWSRAARAGVNAQHSGLVEVVSELARQAKASAEWRSAENNLAKEHVAAASANLTILAAEKRQAEERLAAVVESIDASVLECGCQPGAFCESYGCGTLLRLKKIAEGAK